MNTESCRICLTNNNETLIELFSYKGSRSYAELVTFSCGIRIDRSENDFPLKICTSCAYQVESACDVKQKCIDSDQILKQMVEKKPQEELTNINTEKSGAIEENPIEINLPFIGHKQNFHLEHFIEENATSPSSSEKSTRVKKKQKVLKRQRAKSDISGTKNKKPEEDDYRCFICQKVFDLISAKDSHVKRDHKDLKFCKICSKKKQTAISLENHLRFHQFGYRFLCPQCGKSFRFKNLLENHLKVEHFNEVQFCCDICEREGKVYHSKFKINMERHIKSVHMKIKNFKCLHCSDHEYSTQVGLNLHLYRCHEVPAPVICPDCMQGFTFESELRVHKKHCTGNSARQKKARPQDAPVDVLENGFRCRICLKIYETRSKWSVHHNHKHRSSNVCGICNKKMASSTSLFKHVQVQHNNIKKFQCDVCSKTFGFKHSLESHKNVHTGEKPFPCNLCSFKSGDRSSVSKHKKKMHGQTQMFEDKQ